MYHWIICYEIYKTQQLHALCEKGEGGSQNIIEFTKDSLCIQTLYYNLFHI